MGTGNMAWLFEDYDSEEYKTRRAERKGTQAEEYKKYAQEAQADGEEDISNWFSQQARSQFFLWYDTPYNTALSRNRFDVVRYLHKKGKTFDSECDSEGGNMLFPAIVTKNEEIINWMLDIDPELAKGEDNDMATPLHNAIACLESDAMIRVARRLIELGASVNQEIRYDKTPMEYAIDSGNLEIVQLLIEHGGDKISEYDGPITFLAAERGHPAILKFLLERGYEQEHNGEHIRDFIASDSVSDEKKEEFRSIFKSFGKKACDSLLQKRTLEPISDETPDTKHKANHNNDEPESVDCETEKELSQ